MRYYLRTPDEQEYGPADLETIRQWCREGRIAPDQLISADQQVWQAVTEMPELEFDWFLVLEDGAEAGPFHRAMLEEELAAGNLPAGATFKHRHTGEVQDPQYPTPPSPDSADDTQQPPDTLPDAPGEDAPLQEMAEPEMAAAATPPAPAVEMQDSETALGPEDEEPASLRLETLARHAAEAREQLAETRSNLQSMRTQNSLLQDQNQHLQERMSTAETERDAAEQNLLDMQNQAAQNAAELDNLRAQLAQMQEHYEKLQLENQRQFEQIDDLRATALTAEQTWKRELSVLQTRLEAKSRIVEEVAEIILQDAPHAPRPNAARTVQPPLATAAPAAAEAQNAPAPQAPQPKTPPPKRRPPFAAPPPPYHRPSLVVPTKILLALLLLLLLGFGIFSALSAWRSRAPRNVQHQETQQELSVPAEAQPAPPAPPVSEEALVLQPEQSNHRPRNDQPPVLRSWPVLDLPGTSIEQEENAMRITFEDGLFVSGTRLQDAARQDLLRLARQLRNQRNNFTVIVEGHTDTIPVRPDNERFIDNFSLGMARAEAVKHFLAEQGGLPATRIHTASAGQSAPPYPNDTVENRARNRTVVLSIIP